jgi:ribosomal protein S6--L-glutamate ligase
MKKILIVNAPKKFIERNREIAEAKNITFQLTYLNVIMIHTHGSIVEIYNKKGKISLDTIDFALVRTIFSREKESSKLMASLFFSVLEHEGIPYTDKMNRAYSQKNKFYQMVNLTLAGIECPESFIVTHRSYKIHKNLMISQLGFPLVLKGQGDRGRNVWKVENEEELEKIIEQSLVHEPVFMLQKYFEKEFDIRVLTWKDKIIGSIKRPAPIFKSNVVKGDDLASPIEITQEEQQIALKASQVLDIDFAGTDLLRHNGKTYILEVNYSPIFNGFEQVTGIDVIDTILSDIVSE